MKKYLKGNEENSTCNEYINGKSWKLLRGIESVQRGSENMQRHVRRSEDTRRK